MTWNGSPLATHIFPEMTGNEERTVGNSSFSFGSEENWRPKCMRQVTLLLKQGTLISFFCCCSLCCHKRKSIGESLSESVTRSDVREFLSSPPPVVWFSPFSLLTLCFVFFRKELDTESSCLIIQYCSVAIGGEKTHTEKRKRFHSRLLSHGDSCDVYCPPSDFGRKEKRERTCDQQIKLLLSSGTGSVMRMMRRLIIMSKEKKKERERKRKTIQVDRIG